ncbi:hypothetical protein Hypma_013704 [Hypsizygus marmoreus]|uniref:Uncharacterized protein n=1 Tax=Hypsizygus marmoreus TaxID=39966 RepID=A0A369JD44_HYPMA|nr:hypothetical protein Hypma_013704 [Hypsizygus marmoreus]
MPDIPSSPITTVACSTSPSPPDTPTPQRQPSSATIESTARLGRFVRQVYGSKLEILQFDSSNNCLSVWAWPTQGTHNRQPVPPPQLHAHCRENAIEGPCCLCPLKYPDGQPFIQASCFTVNNLGEPVASCARNICDYLGKSLIELDS